MTEQALYKLKDLFYRIKQFYFGTSDKTLSAAALTSGEATEYISAVKEAEATLFAPRDMRIPPDADDMLRATLGYIREAFLDKDFRLAGDLAALGVQLCGVYAFPFLSRKRFIEKHLIPLREEHGDAFFEKEEAAFLAAPDSPVRLKPLFRRPRDDAYYYEEDSDGEMQRAHPVLYALFAILGGMLFVGAILLYGVLTSLFGLSGAWVILGYAGAAACGMALFSLLMSFIHQYMGHVPTACLAILGGIAIAVSVILL